MSQLSYTFGELKKIVSESGEFRPKIGKNVIKDDAKNNTDAVKKIEKDVKNFDGGLKKSFDEVEVQGINKDDFNRTTLDYNFDDKPDEQYVKRVKSQVMGYNSPENEENSKKDEDADFEENEKMYQTIKNRSGEINTKKTDLKHAGLKSHNLSKKDFEKNTVFKENKIKRLYFKHTKFLSESSMIDKIPDSYKKDGNTFIMKDCEGTEYTVEWKESKDFNYGYANVIRKLNEKKDNEDINRIKCLFEYKSDENSTDANLRENADNYVSNIIGEVRKISK